MNGTVPQRIAVVGAGIAGLSAAWLLSQRHRVTLFEAERQLGGHTHTVDVDLGGCPIPIDTGFLVFNESAYPNLSALFDYLEVPICETEMSFAVSLAEPAVEWATSGLAKLFSQKRNFVRPDFWRMLSDIARFERESEDWLAAHAGDGATRVSEFLAAGNYSPIFRDWYLLPIAAAVWSCPTGRMLEYPMGPLMRFCRNHGLFDLFDRQIWCTVEGGGRTYIDKLAAGIADIRLRAPVRRVHRTSPLVLVATDDGVASFDAVVLACHSDQALALLGQSVRPEEQARLSAIAFQPNRALLHTDVSLLPRGRNLWSAWNCCAERRQGDGQPVCVSYLINRLQTLPAWAPPLIVTLNPVREPVPESVLGEYTYAHPVFDGNSIEAQAHLGKLQGEGRVWFCGAWSGFGFHEDGLRSALAVAAEFECRAPWLGRRRAPREEPGILRRR